jgi:hypothetical protein
MPYYILDDNGEPRRVDNVIEWGNWMEQARRDRRLVVAQDRDESGDTTILVSTVFLGIDHSFGSGRMILWETMVFGGLLDDEQVRYSSRDDAFRGHQEMCTRVRESLHRRP